MYAVKQMKGKPMEKWVDEYAAAHQNRFNQICHSFGIPIIALSLILMPLGAIHILPSSFLWMGIGLFVMGWILRFAGQAIERKPLRMLRSGHRLYAESLETRRVLSADYLFHASGCALDGYETTPTVVVNDTMYAELEGRIHRLDPETHTSTLISNAEDVVRLRAVGSDLFFFSSDGPLYRYDTLTNTEAVFDIDPDFHGGFISSIDRVYFPTVGDDVGYIDLATNQLGVIEIPQDVTMSQNGLLTVSGDDLYFRGYDDAHGTELRRLDVVSGVIETVDINPGTERSNPFAASESDIFVFVRGVAGAAARIVRYEIESGELTWMNGPATSASSQDSHFVIFGRDLYMTGSNGGPLRHYAPDGTVTEYAEPQSQLVPIGSDIYFVDASSRLMRLDTQANQVDDLVEVSTDRIPYVESAGGKLYLTAYDAAHGTELREFDPATGELTLVADIFVGPSSSMHLYQTPNVFQFGVYLVYHAWSFDEGLRLWSVDLQSGEPTAFDFPIYTSFDTCIPSQIVAHEDGLAVVTSTMGIWERGAWYSPGKLPVNLGSGYSVKVIGSVGDTLFYDERHGSTTTYAWDPAGGVRWLGGRRTVIRDDSALYWEQDGFPLETGQWVSYEPATDTTRSDFPNLELAVDDIGFSVLIDQPDFEVVYFDASTADSGVELHRMDLRTHETLAFELVPGADGSRPDDAVGVGTDLFFIADHPTAGRELHRVDRDGVLTTFDINAGEESSIVRELVGLDGDLYFTAYDPDHGRELRRIGQGESTWTTIEVVEGPFDSVAHSVTPVGSEVFFVATDGIAGSELRRWNPADTTLITIDFDLTVSSSPTHMTSAGSDLYFAATDATLGRELFRLDTQNGTAVVRDLNTAPLGMYTGSGDSDPYSLRVIGDELYLQADFDAYRNALFSIAADFEGETRRDVHSLVLQPETLDALHGAIVTGSYVAEFDLNGDDQISLGDRDAWLAQSGVKNLGPGRGYLPGDVNLDGEVDQADLDVMNANLGAVDHRWSAGDLDADGMVTDADLAIWQSNAGQVVGELWMFRNRFFADRMLAEADDQNVITSTAATFESQWFVYTLHGSTVIQNRASGRYLSATDWAVTSSDTLTGNALWEIRDRSSGSTAVENIVSGRFLDADGIGDGWDVDESLEILEDDEWLVSPVTEVGRCDLDRDGQCNIADLDFLYSRFGFIGGPADVDRSSLVDELDILAWLDAASTERNPYLDGQKVFVAGDINLDGAVDRNDLGLLLNNFGRTRLSNRWGDGDLNRDSFVDSTDLGLLLGNFGFQSPAIAPAATAFFWDVGEDEDDEEAGD